MAPQQKAGGARRLYVILFFEFGAHWEEPPDHERTGEVAEDADEDGPVPGCGDAHRDDVRDAVLEAAENEERNAEDDAERRAFTIDSDREVHDDATENGADEEAPADIPALDFGAGSFNDGAITGAEGKTDQIASGEIHEQDREEMERFDLILKEEAALPCKEVGAHHANTEEAEGEENRAKRRANL